MWCNECNETYDHDGNTATAANANGTYTFTYDSDDRLTKVAEPFALTLTYSYDNLGNQTQVVDSLGGTQLSTYDGDGYLTERTYQGQSQTMAVLFSNNKEDRTTRQTDYSNLAATTLVADIYTGYDNVGNVTSIQAINISTATIDQFKYAYDSANRLTSETDTQNSTITTTSYNYDAAGQLTNSTTSGVSTLSYGYDASGNRNTGSDTVTTGNEMSADANWTYKYDNNGNLIEKDSTVAKSSESWTYAWSTTNELTEAKHYNSSGTLTSTVDYQYDAFGNMIERNDGTTTSKFGIDGWNPAMPTPIGNENMNTWVRLDTATPHGPILPPLSSPHGTRYLWSDKVAGQIGRVDMGVSNVTNWVLTDHLGSIRDVVNNAGTVQDYTQYDAYGNITFDSSTANRGWYGYAGQVVDPLTGLQEDHARWYDASMGKWISQDPMGFDAGDSNLYRYVHNQPTDRTDPSGLVPVPKLVQNSLGRNRANLFDEGYLCGLFSTRLTVSAAAAARDHGSKIAVFVDGGTFNAGYTREQDLQIYLDVNPIVIKAADGKFNIDWTSTGTESQSVALGISAAIAASVTITPDRQQLTVNVVAGGAIGGSAVGVGVKVGPVSLSFPNSTLATTFAIGSATWRLEDDVKKAK